MCWFESDSIVNEVPTIILEGESHVMTVDAPCERQ